MKIVSAVEALTILTAPAMSNALTPSSPSEETPSGYGNASNVTLFFCVWASTFHALTSSMVDFQPPKKKTCVLIGFGPPQRLPCVSILRHVNQRRCSLGNNIQADLAGYLPKEARQGGGLPGGHDLVSVVLKTIP